MTKEQLKALRQSHKMSVTQAARMVHVSDRTWQRYERGDITVPGAIVELLQIKLGDTP